MKPRPVTPSHNFDSTQHRRAAASSARGQSGSNLGERSDLRGESSINIIVDSIDWGMDALEETFYEGGNSHNALRLAQAQHVPGLAAKERI